MRSSWFFASLESILDDSPIGRDLRVFRTFTRRLWAWGVWLDRFARFWLGPCSTLSVIRPTADIRTVDLEPLCGCVKPPTALLLQHSMDSKTASSGNANGSTGHYLSNNCLAASSRCFMMTRLRIYGLSDPPYLYRAIIYNMFVEFHAQTRS